MSKGPFNTDCFFFSWQHDMGATFENCDYYREFLYCPCVNCPFYIDEKEVREIIIEKFKKEGKIN